MSARALFSPSAPPHPDPPPGYLQAVCLACDGDLVAPLPAIAGAVGVGKVDVAVGVLVNCTQGKSQGMLSNPPVIPQ